MADYMQQTVALMLDEMREALIYHVSQTLCYRMPLLDIPLQAEDSIERHRENMHLTAQRFHQIVQAGATVDWSLVEFEYEWAGRKLGSLGMTWEHQEILIDLYFAEALRLGNWSDRELKTLEHIATALRHIAGAAYCDTVEPVA